jgi:hypothetical protein
LKLNLKSLLVSLSFLVSLYLAFRVQINSGFHLLLGDGYDGVIEGVIVNHWAHVFSGQRAWTQVGYFYPVNGTLGYNDSYFLYGVLSFFFKVIGLDHFLRVELTHITIRAIGFLAMLALVRQFITSNALAVFSAVVFTVSIGSSNSPHAQLLMISIVPLYCFILIKLWNAKKPSASYAWALGAAVLYGAMAMTAYYVLYFMTLWLLFFMLIAVGLNRGFGAAFQGYRWKTFVLAGVLHLLFIIPFLLVYLPKLKETGGQNYQVALHFIGHAWEVINVGDGSLLWGGGLNNLLRQYGMAMRPEELSHGISPILFMAFVLASFYFYKSKIPIKSFAGVIWLTTLTLMICTIKVGDHSLWWIIYHYVPGAKGVRVVSRIYLVVDFSMILFIAMVASDLWQRCQAKGRWLMTGVFLLLVIERIDTAPPVVLPRTEYLQITSRMQQPPHQCQSFYVVKPEGYETKNHDIDKVYRVNVYAMLMSSILNFPTINGISTFNPPGWDLSYEDIDTYRQRVTRYADKNNQQKNLCEYDAENSAWSQ